MCVFNNYKSINIEKKKKNGGESVRHVACVWKAQHLYLPLINANWLPLVRTQKLGRWLSKTRKLCSGCFLRYLFGSRIQTMIVYVVTVCTNFSLFLYVMVPNNIVQCSSTYIPACVLLLSLEQLDWLNKFVEYMWPYLDKVIQYYLIFL